MVARGPRRRARRCRHRGVCAEEPSGGHINNERIAVAAAGRLRVWRMGPAPRWSLRCVALTRGGELEPLEVLQGEPVSEGDRLSYMNRSELRHHSMAVNISSTISISVIIIIIIIIIMSASPI